MAKISRRRSLQDPEEVLSLAQRLTEALRPYKAMIFGGIGVIVLILAGFLIHDYWQASRQSQAETALEKLRPQLSRPAEAVGVITQLEQLRKDYPGTAAALEAEMFLAQLFYQTGKYADAARAYEALQKGPLGRQASFEALFTDSLSYCHEAQGDFARAAAELAPLVEKTRGVWQGDILLRLAWLSEAAGHQPQARQYYQRLLNQSQDPAMAPYLREKLGAVEGGLGQ